MNTDKEVLQKLFKIAKNQQKIIRKLAQTSSQVQDIRAEVNNLIVSLGSKVPRGTVCLKAYFYPIENIVDSTIKLQNAQPLDENNKKIRAILASAIADMKKIPVGNVKIILALG